MKYMIHCCPKRLWYVESILIPEMHRQGIEKDDIIVYNDENNEGNLISYLNSCKYIIDNLMAEQGLWHLQDDVVISGDFAEKTKEVEYPDEIVNGFVTERFNKKRFARKGRVGILSHWNSFPCMYIPTRLSKGFFNWFYKVAIKEEFYADRIEEGRGDDYIFWAYIRREHTNTKCLNLAPNVADHIDFMIGGSVANSEREGTSRAVWFEDRNALDKVKEQISLITVKDEKQEETEAEEKPKPKARKPRAKKKVEEVETE